MVIGVKVKGPSSKLFIARRASSGLRSRALRSSVIRLRATRVVDASLTVICCPNAVVQNWADETRKTFPKCEVAQKTWHPEWKHPLGTSPRYLVLNYEQFQQPNSEAELVAFLERNVVDFVVVDEIHYAKQRDAGVSMSKRKRLVQGLILEAGKKNVDLSVLGMSGTPVINTLQEGRSLIEMITGHRHDDLETRATVQNCMRLYQRLVTLGTTSRPTSTLFRDPFDATIDRAVVRLEFFGIADRAYYGEASNIDVWAMCPNPPSGAEELRASRHDVVDERHSRRQRQWIEQLEALEVSACLRPIFRASDGCLLHRSSPSKTLEDTGAEALRAEIQRELVRRPKRSWLQKPTSWNWNERSVDS